MEADGGRERNNLLASVRSRAAGASACSPCAAGTYCGTSGDGEGSMGGAAGSVCQEQGRLLRLRWGEGRNLILSLAVVTSRILVT